MKKTFTLLCLGLFLYSCSEKKIMPADEITLMPYPVTEKDGTVDDYFGTKIEDPYRWLENDSSEATAAWVKAQNEVTQNYLSQIPYREALQKRITDVWNYERFGQPFLVGDYVFFYKNDGLQNQSVLYKQTGLDGEPEVFIDPNKLSEGGTVSLSGLTFSNDYKYCAYNISKAGSDWNTIFVKEVATGKVMTDSIAWVKFSSASWYKDGFYYSRYDEPKGGTGLSQQNEFHKVYYHKLGTPQTEDKLVYWEKDFPKRYFFASVTDDERYLIIYSSEGTSGNAVYVQDLADPAGKLNLVLPGFKNNYSVIDNEGDKLMVLTDNGASKYRLVSIDPKNADPANWTNVIEEGTNLLQNVGTAGNYLFATYLQDASTKIAQYDRAGKKVRDVPLPGIGTSGGISGSKKQSTTFYSFSGFTAPNLIYKFEVESGESTLFKAPKLSVDLDQFETKQVFYESNDGTKVPMFIVHKKGLKLDGTNPTYLYAYGGFNINITPSFSAARLVMLENGAVYAVPNLRGGGEYGEEWHKAGMLDKKQNVFDDFIAAAEYLIEEGYTSSEKLAIAGGSNGGLLVGAVMTQRPELFKVAFPAVGVLDMLRYHKFTIGWGWAVEYGSSDFKDQFDYLIKYSPLHNLKKGTAYPATMITTADHDDRVVPAHSFKFAATLQEMHQGTNPVLIRIETDAGHGAGKPISKSIQELADIYAFFFQNTGHPIIKKK